MRIHKNIIAPLIAALMLVGPLPACKVVNYSDGNTEITEGDGNVTTVDVSASDFSGVALRGAANVNISFGSSYNVKVTTDSNIQKLVSIAVNNGVLDVSETGGYSNAEVTVDITLPALQTLEILGAGSANVGPGSADAFELTISGVGSVDAQNYEAKTVTANLLGVGSAKVWATDSLSGKISGTGSVHYKGDPELNVNVSGLGGFNPL